MGKGVGTAVFVGIELLVSVGDGIPVGVFDGDGLAWQLSTKASRSSA